MKIQKIFYNKNESVSRINHLRDFYCFEPCSLLLNKKKIQKECGGNLFFYEKLYYVSKDQNYLPFAIDLKSQIEKIIKEKRHVKDLLLRAVKGKHAKVNSSCSPLIVIDACAGTLNDALVMLLNGIEVISFEKNRIIFDLLFDALQDIPQSYLAKHKLIHGDFFKQVSSSFVDLSSDKYLNKELTIYLDPMFNHVKKSLSKKNMIMLNEIIELDQKNSKQKYLQDCFELKKYANIKKIIVKRADKKEALESIIPDYSLKSKTIRFDVYNKREREIN